MSESRPRRRAARRAPRRLSLVSRGFTLIELMIVVAIVALLASIAYPAYTNAVVKGKRGEGRTALIDLMQQQERYLTQTGSYGYNGSAIARGTTGVPFKMYSGDDRARAAYLLGARACTIAPAPSLRDCIEVYGDPQFTDAQAGSLWVRSTGEKGCSGGTDASVCWK